MNAVNCLGGGHSAIVTRAAQWGGGHFSATAVGLRLALALNHQTRSSFGLSCPDTNTNNN